MGKDTHPPIDPTLLLEQGPWIARLARSLTSDEDLAHDLTQDTFVAALRTPPRDAALLRPWIARVLQNLLRQRRRSDSNRRAREAAQAHNELLPSASDTAERLEMQRRLVDALAGLEEPLRTTIVARYFDGLSAVEIAEREGVPASTVRGRLMRGIEALRARLDRDCGGRANWAIGFVSLFAGAEVPVAVAGAAGFTGWLIMSSTTRLVTVGAVLVLSSLGIWVAVREPALEKDPVSAAAPVIESPQVPRPDGPNESALATAGVAAERALVAPARTEEVAVTAVSGKPSTKLDVRFVDVSGRVIPGVRVLLPHAAGGASVTSDEAGRAVFDMALDSGATVFDMHASCAGFADAHQQAPVRQGETKFLGDVVMEFGGSVAGLVLGPDGAPFADAELRFAKPEGFSRDATLARRGPAGEFGGKVRSAADGSFRADGLPARSLAVGAGAPGMRWTIVEPVEVPARGITAGIVLKLAPLAREDAISGIVLDPAGAPVARASLSYVCYKDGSSTSSTMTTDADGRFEIRAPEIWMHDVCVRDPAGKRPAVSMRSIQPGTRDLVLQFVDAATTRLTVKSKSGAPLESFKVDMTPEVDGKLDDSLWSAEHKQDDGDALVVPLPSAAFRLVVSAPGHERVELGPFDPRATPRETSCALAPIEGLRGRVLAGGSAVAGAKLELRRPIKKKQEVSVSGFPSRFDPTFDESTTSDADGNFLLTPRRGGTYVVLCIADGHALAESAPLELEPGRAAGPLEITLDQGGVIEGRVIVASGIDPAGIIVSACRHDMHPRTLRVGHDGRFRFDQLTTGTWMVERAQAEYTRDAGWAMSDGKKPKDLPTNCNVVAGEVTRLDVDLSRDAPATIVGHISNNGAGAKGFRLSIWPEGVNSIEGELPAGVVDERGDVRIVVEKPGKYEIHLNDGFSLYAQIPITLAPGTNPWTLELETGSLRGRVLDEKARNATLVVFTRSNLRMNPFVAVEIHPDGSFRLPNVPAGAAEVRLQRGWDDDAEVLAKKEVVIIRGQEIELDLP